ncbi:MAG: hypothetical protein KatS3mg105_3919 [Gemmatales bacterium]|nr:MAG: hypothetical protein KatS3mg105_3919 [Gemmatales bacterium]
MKSPDRLRRDARSIFEAALTAVRADDLILKALADPELAWQETLQAASRILVVGAGKAGAAMSSAFEWGASRRLVVSRRRGRQRSQ